MMVAEERYITEEWSAFGEALGWELWSGDGRQALFFDARDGCVQITSAQRDDILRAISSAQEVK